jgi:soluble P-type ATPase
MDQYTSLSSSVNETSLYEEMRQMKQAQETILKQLKGVAEQTVMVANTVADEPELKSLCLEGVSLTL